jgi:hypothetical protein
MGRIRQWYLEVGICIACERERADVQLRNGWPLCVECQVELMRMAVGGPAASPN